VRRTSKLYINGLLLLCLTLLLPALHTAHAATPGQTADGLHYFKDAERVTIYQYDGADTAITIPETIDKVPVTGIEDWTFANNASLTSVTLPDKVTRIGNGAFSGCSGLTTVNIPAGVTSIGIRTFSGCGSLAGITLPNNMNSIGDEAFANCSSLTSITIPSSVTSIGTGAFLSTSVIIHCSVGSKAHTYAKKNNISYVAQGKTPEGLEYKTDGKKVTVTGYKGTSKAVIIPESIDGVAVTDIAERAFESDFDQIIITIPDSVINIANNAITGPFIKIHGYPNSAAHTYAQTNNILFVAVGKNTSEGLHYIINGKSATITDYTGTATRITIPDKVEGVPVTSIGEYAFRKSNLTSITLPSGIHRIGEGAFSWSKLETITIPDGVKHIERSAFYASGLTSVTLPQSLESIGDSAFECSNIKSITIPKSVTNIGISVFYPNPVTIHCYKGSHAHQYAEKNGIPFVIIDAPALLPGDANGDGKVNIGDLESLINYLISKTPCPSMDNADANGDSVVDIQDLKRIIDKIVGV
jgi:hypothetical protein